MARQQEGHLKKNRTQMQQVSSNQVSPDFIMLGFRCGRQVEDASTRITLMVHAEKWCKTLNQLSNVMMVPWEGVLVLLDQMS